MNGTLVWSSTTMRSTWQDDDDVSIKTLTEIVTGMSSPSESSTYADVNSGDVLRRLTSQVVDADVITVSTPITAIMVVSAFIFLTVFSVIAYVMRVRYRHQVTTWHHVEEEGIQLQPFIRNA